MATTAHTILTAEPSRVHTITSLTFLVSTQAHTYLLTKPYAVRSQPWLTTHLERLISPCIPSSLPLLRKPQLHPPRFFGKTVMSEDVLLLLSGLLSYRVEMCRHATRYKDLVWPEYRDCAGCDVEREVEKWLAFDPSPPPPAQNSSSSRGVGQDKEAQRQKAARRQGRIVALQGVMDMIDAAELFAKPPGKYSLANKEAKGVVYLALVVLENRDREGKKVEELVERLGGGESFYVFPVFCFDLSVGWGGDGLNVLRTRGMADLWM